MKGAGRAVTSLKSLYLFPMQFVIWYTVMAMFVDTSSIFGRSKTLEVLIIVLFIPFLVLAGVVSIQSRLPL